MGHGPDSTDFERLNPAERSDLILLAQGHTAKSIANLTGRSVGAVNERLREARRKTGMGSSRELARIVAAQENRDELIGVARATIADPDDGKSAALRGRIVKGVTLMSLVLATAAAIAFAAQPAPQTAPVDPNGSDAAVLANEPTPRALHDKLTAETRDAAWAAPVEVALGQWFATAPGVAGTAQVSRVRCGATLCEVVGSFAPGLSGDRINGAMQPMQGKPFLDAIAPLKLKMISGSFVGNSFAIFVSRQPD